MIKFSLQKSRIKKVFFLSLITCLLSLNVNATAIKWVGGAVGNWSNTASWSPAQIPTSSDDVTFDNSVAGNTSPSVTLTADLGTTSVLSMTFTSSNVIFLISGYTPTNPLGMTNMTLTGSTVTFAIGIKVNNTLSVSGGSIVKLCPNTTTGPYTNTIGNGTTGTLSGMNASNYFQGATTPFSSLAFNGPTSSTAFAPYFVSTSNMYAFNITKGVVTIGGSIGISRLTLQSTGSMILGSGASLTLTGSGTSTYNGGTINASDPTSSVIFTGAIDYSALLTSPFSANTINSFQINGASSTVVKLGIGNTIKNLILTSGILDNATQNITMADGGTITKVNANLTAPPVFGTSSSHRVNVVYGSNLSTGIELLGSPGKVGNLTVNDGCTVYPSNSGLKSIAIGGTLTGYTNPTVTVAAPNTGGTTASLKVLTSGTAPNMTITGVVVTNPGSGYTTTPIFTLSDATGSGATFTPTFNTANPTVDSIIVGNGTSGTLNFPNSTNAVTLTVNKGIRVLSGGTFTTGAQSSVVSHQLLVGGCINNSGSFTLKGSGTTKSTDLTLNGTGTQLLSGTPLFYKVSITNTTTPITTSSALDFTTLSIASGATLNMGTYDMTGSSFSTSGTGILKTQSTSTTPIPSVTYTFTVEYNNPTGGQSVIGTTYGGLTISNTSGINTATAALTVNGVLNIASNATLDMSTYQLLGTISNTGLGLLQTANTTVPPIPTGLTWTGTVSFTGSSNQTVPAGSFNNLTLAGTRTGSGAITLIASGTINIAGAFSPIATFSTGNYVVTNNTLVFNGSTSQVIPSFTFNNLTISNANTSITSGGTVTVNSLFTVNADFIQNVNSIISAKGGVTINSGKTYTIQGTGVSAAINSLNSVNGVLLNGSSSTITNNGTLTINGYFKNSSSTTTFAGSYSVTNNAVYENAMSGGNLPTATWAANSYLYFTGNGSIASNTGQSFGNVIWNSTTQSSGLQAINPTEIKGKLVVLNTNGKNIYLSNNAINAANSISIGNGIIVGSGASGYSFNGSTITTSSAIFYLNENNTYPLFPPTIAVTGDVTVGSASGTAEFGTFRAASLSITGDWNINAGGTFTQANTTVVFNGSTAQNINAATTFNALTIANSGAGVTLGSGAALAINADLTLTSGTLNDGGNTITLQGNLAGTGTYSGSSKISMTGSSKTISGVTLDNLEIASSGTVTALAGITINGNLTLTSGTLADGGNTITLLGNLAGTATHSGAGRISMTGATKTISGATLSNLEIASSGTITASAAPTISGILTLTSGTLSDGGNTITVSGGIAGTGTHIGTGEIKIIGSGSRSISAVTLKNLENASSSGTVTFSGATIDALTLTSGTMAGTSNILTALNFNGGGYGVGSGNTLTLYNGSTVTRNSGAANLTNSSGVVKWGTSSSDLINITINTSVNNSGEISGSETPGSIGTLTIANGATYTWTSGRNVTNLINNGTLSMAGTCAIRGTISGSGSITSSTASLTLSGAIDGDNGTLYFTNGSTLTNLTINKTGTNASVTLGSPISLLGNLTLTAGTLDNVSNILTLSSGSTITRTLGSITASPTFGSTVNVIYNNTSSTITGFELPSGSDVLNNFSISNAGGVILNSSITVNGVCSFSSGKLTLGNNNLTFASSVTTSGTPSSSKYLVVNGTGTFTYKSLGNAAKLFPIGTSSSYTPLTITNTSGTSDITVSVSPTISNPPIDASKMVNLQWSVLSSAPTSSTIGFQFNLTDKASGYTVGLSDLGDYTTNSFYSINKITTSGSSIITGTSTGLNLESGITNLFVIGNVNAVEASFTTWNGAISSDWTITGNWTNGIPGAGLDATIAAAGKSPVINGTVTIRNLILNSGASLTNNGTLNMAANFINNGTISGSGNTILNGTSSQTISGTGTVSNLTLNNSAGATISSGSNNLGVSGILTLQSGQLTTNGNLTFKSTSIANTGTLAPYGASGNTGTINGTVTVERYIPAGYRAYRDMAAQLSGVGTIYTNWQEGGSFTSGKGIFITGSGATDANTANYASSQPVPNSNGLDYSLNGNNSAFTYSYPTFTPIANTKVTLDPFVGYRVLIRGDRSFNLATTPIVNYYGIGLRMVNATVLRSVGGKLITGTVTYNTTNASGTTYDGSAISSSAAALNNTVNSFSLVANPYVAPVMWGTGTVTNSSTTTVYGASSNINGSYWYFDPTLGSTGFYRAYNAITGSSTYTNADNSASSGAAGYQYIQPGQAIFVQTSAASPTVVFKETAKAVNSTKLAVFGATAPLSKIYISLLKKDSVATYNRVDGAAIAFNEGFTNEAYGPQDALKFGNANDNLYITDKGKNLSIDGRLPATAADKLPIAINKVSGTNYQLVVDATNYTSNGFAPYLVDSYRGTVSTLTNGTNTITFTADANVAATYSNRFSIAFKPTTLAVNSIVASATLNNKIATISWNTVGEKGVSRFEVEKSTDAKTFTKIGQTIAKNTSTASYSATDNSATATTSYYRIKAISEVGTVSYSNLVQLTVNSKQFTVYPNPLVGKTLNVSLANIAAGKYTVAINNVLGQKVQEVAISHAGGNGSHSITVNNTIAAGTYSVTVRDANGQTVYQSNLAVQQ